jgi:DNA-binding transcriptional LysR family regulator
VDLTPLRAFVQVSEAGSITAAAPVLGCSQPGLSQRIQALETRLGCRVFHREPSGVRLTPTGRDLLPLARIMLTVEEQMHDVLNRNRPGPPDKQPENGGPTHQET